jgi:hypothetical protein
LFFFENFFPLQFAVQPSHVLEGQCAIKGRAGHQAALVVLGHVKSAGGGRRYMLITLQRSPAWQGALEWE